MNTHSTEDTTPPRGQEPSPAAALHRLQQQGEALQAYFMHFVRAKIDSGLLSVQQLVLGALLGVVGLIALAGLVVTATVLLLVGVAAGLALLCNGWLWLGQVVVGSGILLLLALTIRFGLRTWQHRWYQQKVQQYANTSSTNVPPADTVLPTATEKTRHSNTDDTREFLAQQAADAHTAMQRTVADMQAAAHEVVDVRWWTQQYPWYAVGVVAVLGFLTATHVLAPSPSQTPAAPPVQERVSGSSSWIATLCAVVCRMLVRVMLDAWHTQSQPSERN